MKTNPILIFFLGLVVDRQDPQHITADPVRCLLLAFSIAAIITGAHTAVVIALVLSLTVTSSLALWQSGTSRPTNED